MSQQTTVDARQRFVEINLPGWRNARRYGAPATMVEAASRRRLTGDWRGACAAAGVDVRISLPDVRDRHGSEVLARLGDDLLHLAPDLLRWHAPRDPRGGMGLLTPNRFLVLADYGHSVCLYACTPQHAERPQRVILCCGPMTATSLPREIRAGRSSTVDDWTEARYLWDARASAQLLTRLGGGDRTPFFHRDGRRLSDVELSAPKADDPVAVMERVLLLQDAGEIEAAWATGGVAVDFALPENYRWPDQIVPESFSAMVPLAAAAARARLIAADAPPGVLLRSERGWGPVIVGLSLDAGQLRGRRVDYRSFDDDGGHVDWVDLPRPLWQRMPDLELLRSGRIGAAQLHPLVRAALFPEQPDPGYDPGLPTVDAEEVRIRCRGQWHRVGWRGGRLTLADHLPEEVERERVMRQLGGQVPACVTLTETWRGTESGRLPAAMRQLRFHALASIHHGNAAELDRLLDTGLDLVGVRDRWRRGPLHHLAKLPEADGAALLNRLLAAGADINERDLKGRTPLGWVLFDGGSATLVRLLLDAGADPLALDAMNESTLHLTRSLDGAIIVPWLIAAGVDKNAYDEYGRTPIMTQLLADAPVETIRATYEAGADLTVTDQWTEEGLAELLERTERPELDFLVDAVASAESSAEDDQ